MFENLKFNKYDLNSFSTVTNENLFLVVFYDSEDADNFKMKKLHDIIFWIAVPLKNQDKNNVLTSIYNSFN